MQHGKDHRAGSPKGAASDNEAENRFEAMQSQLDVIKRDVRQIARLNRRQLEVLLLMADAMPDFQTAEALFEALTGRYLPQRRTDLTLIPSTDSPAKPTERNEDQQKSASVTPLVRSANHEDEPR